MLGTFCFPKKNNKKITTTTNRQKQQKTSANKQNKNKQTKTTTKYNKNNNNKQQQQKIIELKIMREIDKNGIVLNHIGRNNILSDRSIKTLPIWTLYKF